MSTIITRFVDSAPRFPQWAALWLGVAALVIVNLFALTWQWRQILAGNDGYDWLRIFVPVTQAANPYDVPMYVWSPLAVPVLSAVVPLGLGFWWLLHGVALMFIRPWSVAALVALSAPFWWDVGGANVLTFVFVAAWSTMRGSRVGAIAFMVMALLMPRPLMLPLLGWLLWQQPWTRLPFLALVAANGFGVLATGFADEWIATLMAKGPYEIGGLYNFGPSRIIGQAWIPIGLVLAAVLTWRGRIGLASLAASPYLLPYYFLFGFLDLSRPCGRTDSQPRAAHPASPSWWRIDRARNA